MTRDDIDTEHAASACPPQTGCPSGAYGATRFADQLSLVSTADAAGVNPGSYIADILPRIDTWPHRRLDELLPHAWAVAGEQPEQPSQ